MPEKPCSSYVCANLLQCRRGMAVPGYLHCAVASGLWVFRRTEAITALSSQISSPSANECDVRSMVQPDDLTDSSAVSDSAHAFGSSPLPVSGAHISRLLGRQQMTSSFAVILLDRVRAGSPAGPNPDPARQLFWCTRQVRSYVRTSLTMYFVFQGIPVFPGNLFR